MTDPKIVRGRQFVKKVYQDAVDRARAIYFEEEKRAISERDGLLKLLHIVGEFKND